jgi:hypothetical protein
MELFLYAPVSKETRERVARKLESVLPEDGLRVCSTIGNLCQNLRMPKQDLTIAVLVPANRGDLLELRSIRPMFRDVKILLVLPDTEEETIAMAHRFRPRYVTCVTGNLSALGAVVTKMRENSSELEIAETTIREDPSMLKAPLARESND